jgi:putative iron-dependent peroxidase
MPYGSVAKGELGTYFIGYARNPDITERMLRNMFLGDPPGNYDHLLDYSHPVTGAMFFAPPLDFLDALSS